MEYSVSSIDEEEFLIVLDEMITDLRYDTKVYATYQQIKEFEEKLKFSKCYFLVFFAYLLLFIYQGNNQISEVQKKYYFNTLKENIEHTPVQYQALLCDTLGCCCLENNNTKEALALFEQALSCSKREEDDAISLYHIGFQKSFRGYLSEALELFTRAKSIFDRHILYIRGLMCQIEIGIVYMQLGLYDKAEQVYLECIRCSKHHDILLSKLICTYNNLMWLYVSSKQYEKVLALESTVLKIDKMNPNYLSYIGISYYHLDEKEIAKKYLEKSKVESTHATKTHNAVIDVYLTIINRNRYREIENKIKLAYEEAIKCFDHQCQIYLLELLIEMQTKFEKWDKQRETQSLLYQKMMEKR
jgi:tetratricopeptide (TPR) repeat protein